MSRLLQRAREDGWAQLLPRALAGLACRLRDRLTASRLRAPGFRAGKSPRLLGLGHMRIGRHFNAGDHVWIEAVVAYRGILYSPELTLGDHINLSDNVHIACLHRVTIGDGLLSGSQVLISDHTHGVYSGADQSAPSTPPAARPLHSTGAVTIGRNVWLGDGVRVLAGAEIGDGAIIGANSVVRGSIPAETIAVGSPARPVRRWSPEQHAWVKLD